MSDVTIIPVRRDERLRELFVEMDARASRAEADADRLAAAIISTGFAAERVSMALAMLQHDEAVAAR